jgi:hypothetical protein
LWQVGLVTGVPYRFLTRLEAQVAPNDLTWYSPIISNSENPGMCLKVIYSPGYRADLPLPR